MTPAVPANGHHRRVRVTMLTQNQRANDARVIREAESLAAAGYDVSVICRTADVQASSETRRGVTYRVVPHRAIPRLRHTARLLRTHVWVLAFDARRILRGPGRVRALSSAVELLVVPLLAFGLAVSIALRRQAWTQPSEGDRATLTVKALQPLARRLQRVARWLIQPVLYLNDHAASCVDEICALEPEVVHAHDLVTLSAGILVSHRTGARLVYDAHEIETQTNNWSLHAVTQHYVRRYETVIVTETDAVVTVTEKISEWLSKAYTIERPVVVMNAPSSRRRRGGDGLKVRDQLRLHSSVPLVVYVGGVMSNRGLEECVLALQHLPDVHLALIGPRFAETERAVVDEAIRVGVESRVHLVDPVPPDSVVEFVSGADCGVIPIQNVCLSYYYCFPNKLLETVIAGVPVAVSDLFELRRFIEETGVGVVMDERSPESIAAAIREILLRRAHYEVTPARIEAILARYGWEVQERRLHALYERLAATGGETIPAEGGRRAAALFLATGSDS